jgi:CBS domain-containing protein
MGFQQNMGQKPGEGHEHPSMYSPLSTVLRKKPVTCLPDTAVKTVLATLHRLAIGSMVVTGEDEKPVGIFTLHDLLNRVTVPGIDLDQPISRVMSGSLITLPPQAPAYEAALAMTSHGIRHVLVVENNKLVGVVSENDLFSLQRIGLKQISTDIRGARNLESLVQSSRDIRQLGHNMLTQGVAAEPLTQYISTLNDLLTRRIIELESATVELEDIRYCWLSLGSEGRFEQTLGSDQDNGIIFAHPDTLGPEVARQALLPMARRVNEALKECEFPLCKGNIMASNPLWCLSLAEWKDKFSAWIDQGDPGSLLNAAVFFDFRPLCGATSLAEELRDWLTRRASNPRFLHLMADNALRNRPPLGWLRDFVVQKKGEYPDTLDLKLNGTHLFVDAARIFSLATQIPHTNTQQRLRTSAPLFNIPLGEAEAWIEAFGFVLLLRMRHQSRLLSEGKPMHNHMDPRGLNELNRNFLKQSLRQVRKLQTRLTLDFRL